MRGRSGSRDLEMAEMRAFACERDAGGAWEQGLGAPIPRLLVITCPEEAAGELKASGREIKTKYGNERGQQGWEGGEVGGRGGPESAERASEVGEREVDGARWGDGREERD